MFGFASKEDKKHRATIVGGLETVEKTMYNKLLADDLDDVKSILDDNMLADISAENKFIHFGLTLMCLDYVVKISYYADKYGDPQSMVENARLFRLRKALTLSTHVMICDFYGFGPDGSDTVESENLIDAAADIAMDFVVQERENDRSVDVSSMSSIALLKVASAAKTKLDDILSV